MEKTLFTIDKVITDKQEIYSVNWLGSSMPQNAITINLDCDGRITINIEKGYLYKSEAVAFSNALFQAIERDNERTISRQKELAARYGDMTEHQGVNVSLSINQTIAVLHTRKIENGKIHYNGKLLSLCKTDLMDDVRLGICDYSVDHLIGLVKFGARIDDKDFCIISGYSDG